MRSSAHAHGGLLTKHTRKRLRETKWASPGAPRPGDLRVLTDAMPSSWKGNASGRGCMAARLYTISWLLSLRVTNAEGAAPGTAPAEGTRA